jgi:hypothetical protein
MTDNFALRLTGLPWKLKTSGSISTTTGTTAHHGDEEPYHPGEVIRSLCLEPLELGVTKAAKFLASAGRRCPGAERQIEYRPDSRPAGKRSGLDRELDAPAAVYDLAQIQRSAAIKVKRYRANNRRTGHR